MTATDVFAEARAVASAVLYEGYVLYPYRASSSKNRTRWQFGVLMPPGYVANDPSERATSHTEIVFEPRPGATLHVELGFLHAQHRTGGDQPEWDEAEERRITFDVDVDRLRTGPHEHLFTVPAESSELDGLRRESAELTGAVRVDATALPGPYGAQRLAVMIANRSAGDASTRDAALRHALVAAHALFALDGGRFLSLTDPPEWAAAYVADCRNDGTWPVLVGSDELVLASPIILGDHPEIAPESPSELYDGTEIDEILTLRTMTLTDAEKAEARATDPRAARVIDQVDGLPPEQLDRLHGALRYLRHVTGPDPSPSAPEPPGDLMSPSTPWWDPGADASVSPATDAIIIDGVAVARGSTVRLRPGRRRTDAQDLFLAGRTATVEAVLFDVDGEQHVGVIVDGDDESAEIQRWHGRFLYFAPDEIEPVVEADR